MLKVLFVSNDVLEEELVCALLPPFSDLDSTSRNDQELVDLCLSSYSFIILDIDLPDWRKRLNHIRQASSPPPVFIMAPEGETRTIVDAMRAGAYDWIKKPIDGTNFLRRINRILSRCEDEGRDFNDPSFANLIGASPVLAEVKRLAVKFAVSDKPILLTGESGTGKGIIASAIHRLSPRRDGPYRFRNCGALAPNLIESEWFGTVAGAYTDARDRPGDFELTRDGTYFMDEIGEIPLGSQPKLLRVIEEGVFYRVGGGSKLLTTNARIIAATNRNLEEMVRDGRFREDLYYRIKFLPIAIPPLRERREDIPALCRFFLKETGKQLDQRALDAMIDYEWPGNIRQLSACLSRAALAAEGERIQTADLIY